MKQENAIQRFENKKGRTLWDAENEQWFFSIVDVIEVLTEKPNARKYWSLLKVRRKKEGNELATNCSQLRLQFSGGKFHKTDVADTEQLFCSIDSIAKSSIVCYEN
jgi:hypothetical protein